MLGTIRISGHQSNYHPYLGYFGKLSISDKFILADDMQFGRWKFQHRQRWPLPGNSDGAWAWSTIPLVKDHKPLPIQEKRILKQGEWQNRHFEMIEICSRGLRYRDELLPGLRVIYGTPHSTLTEINTQIIQHMAASLGDSVDKIYQPPPSHRYRSLQKGRRIAAEIRDVMAGAPNAVYICGEMGAQYLLDRAKGSALREVDFIKAVAREVIVARTDTELIAQYTKIPSMAPALLHAMSVGPAVLADILRTHTTTRALESM